MSDERKKTKDEEARPAGPSLPLDEKREKMRKPPKNKMRPEPENKGEEE